MKAADKLHELLGESEGRIEEIKRRHAAATGGECQVFKSDAHFAIAVVEDDYIIEYLGEARRKGDALLFAHSYADIAFLLSEVERLSGAVDGRDEILSWVRTILRKRREGQSIDSALYSLGSHLIDAGLLTMEEQASLAGAAHVEAGEGEG